VNDANQIQETAPYEGIRLIEFDVEKLFDEFDYEIPLNVDQHVTAVIAPNGTGKTLCLRMIAGLFEQKWTVFSDNVFSKITYHFNEGTSIEISKKLQGERDEQSPEQILIHVVIKNPSGEVIDDWTPRIGHPRHLMQIERSLPFLTRIGSDIWRHDHTGETYSASE
jgi:hypothetical protein